SPLLTGSIGLSGLLVQSGRIGSIDWIVSDVGVKPRASARKPDGVLGRPLPSLRVVVPSAESHEAGLGVVDPTRKPEGLFFVARPQRRPCRAIPPPIQNTAAIDTSQTRSKATLRY